MSDESVLGKNAYSTILDEWLCRRDASFVRHEKGKGAFATDFLTRPEKNARLSGKNVVFDVLRSVKYHICGIFHFYACSEAKSRYNSNLSRAIEFLRTQNERWE